MKSITYIIALSILLPATASTAAADPSRQDQTQALAVTIAAEAASHGYTGMYYVANTIANRAKRQGKTPYQIITARNQYYGYTATNRYKRYADVKAIADKLAAQIMVLPDRTGGATFFRQPNEKRCAWHRVETMRYKNHIFYRE